MRQRWISASIALAVLATLCVGAYAGTSATTSTAARAQIVTLERRRCEAIGSGDAKTLAVLLDDEYVHVHGTGKIDNKAGFIANIMQRPRKTERGELTVRLFGDIAIVTGEQFNYMQADSGKAPERSKNQVTQVLRRVGGQWKYLSFQLTPESGP
jgi:ketosteroid isomerase-like protein